MPEEFEPPARPYRSIRALALSGFGTTAVSIATIVGPPVIAGLIVAVFLTMALIVAMPVMTACWIAIKDDTDAIKRINALNQVIGRIWTPPKR